MVEEDIEQARLVAEISAEENSAEFRKIRGQIFFHLRKYWRLRLPLTLALASMNQVDGNSWFVYHIRSTYKADDSGIVHIFFLASALEPDRLFCKFAFGDVEEAAFILRGEDIIFSNSLNWPHMTRLRYAGRGHYFVLTSAPCDEIVDWWSGSRETISLPS